MQGREDFDEVVVYGARGTALVILRALRQGWQGRVTLRALIDDLDHGFVHPILGVPVISGAERAERFGSVPVLLTITNPAVRARLAARLEGEGAVLATALFRDSGAVERNVSIGAGSHVMPYVRLGANVTLGRAVQFLGQVAGHDVEIGDFTNIGFNATLLGHIRIGAGVNIAPGAVISNGTARRPMVIGDGAKVGPGAVVMRNVAAGETVVGNPAMPLAQWGRLQRLLRRSGSDG